jgi:hypothetical protein
MRVLRPRSFDRRAKLAGLDENDLADLIKVLVERPDQGAVIPGTGGARKVRVKLPGRGKRGGARVIYAVVLRATALALLDVYAKNDQENLTPAERKIVAGLIRTIEAEFEP